MFMGWLTWRMKIHIAAWKNITFWVRVLCSKKNYYGYEDVVNVPEITKIAKNGDISLPFSWHQQPARKSASSTSARKRPRKLGLWWIRPFSGKWRNSFFFLSDFRCWSMWWRGSLKGVCWPIYSLSKSLTLFQVAVYLYYNALLLKSAWVHILHNNTWF